MEKTDLKEMLEQELREIKLSEAKKYKIKKQILGFSRKKKAKNLWKNLAAAVAVVLIGGTTVVAGQYALSKTEVNQKKLPELDGLKITKINRSEYIEEDFLDYKEMKQKLGVPLLDSELSEGNPYMIGHTSVDDDMAEIIIDNFIIGDTSEYTFLGEENRYSFREGEKYVSPVSLMIEMILSEEQLEIGLNKDYLGAYEYMETYTSAQGYKVNMIQSTILESEKESIGNYMSEKVAIFVADGIQYTLKGRVSVDTMKEIVDTMKYFTPALDKEPK